MKFDPHRPLLPQLAEVFDPKRHGTTVPAILEEMARRIDALDAVKFNIARRFTLVDSALEEAGLRPSYKPPSGGGGRMPVDSSD